MLMQLRSCTPKTEEVKVVKKDKIIDLPYIKYNGKISYHTDFIDCAFMCDKLLADINKLKDIIVIGFDMEWPFSFQTGSGKTALIQISHTLEECLLLHVFEFQKLPKALTDLLAHPNVRLTGVNIKNDIHKLGRDFPGVNRKCMLENCIELGTMAKKFDVHGRSMQALVNHAFNMQINKSKSVRNSKWNVIPLTKLQMEYAAIDSFVSLKLYQYFKDLEDKENIN